MKIIKKIKRKIKNCISLLKQTRKKIKNRFFLLMVPSHSNLGDQAIYIAEKKFLNENYKDYDIVEVYDNQVHDVINLLKYTIKKNDVILIHGGGFIGTLWINEHKLLVEILSKIKNNKIIIFPQTIYFSCDDYGKQIMNEFINLCLTHKDLLIFSRDYISYKFLNENRINTKFVPDIVLYLENKGIKKKKDKILLCLRKDKEQIIFKEKIINILKEEGYLYDVTDTVIDDLIYSIEDFRELSMKKIEDFSNYRLVITDRLHGMLFSYLAVTPCVFFDNISKKVSGVYEWIRNDCNYIYFNDANEISKDIIDKYFNLNEFYYNYEKLKNKFLEIKIV